MKEFALQFEERAALLGVRIDEDLPAATIDWMICGVASTWYWNPNRRFLKRNAWFLQMRVELITTLPVGAGGLPGGGLGGAGNLGKSKVS